MSNRVLLCGIGKLENDYIREWVEYHKRLGFTNIVLYDNNDPDGERFEDVIGDYIKSGYVILKNWRGRELAQIPSYNECYKEYHGKYDWIGFWDIDEFIEFENEKTIQGFLGQKKFKDAQCIRIGWKQYTDSGLIRVVNGNYSVKRFTEVFDEAFCKKNKIPVKGYISSNIQAKSIIRTNVENFEVTSPHCFLDVPTVNAMGKPAKKAIQLGTKPVWRGAWLNHYRFKTLEEYITKKMVRLWPTKYMNGGKDRLDLDYFFLANKKTKEKVKFAEDLMEDLDKNKVSINSWTRRDGEGELIHRNWGDEINFFFLQNIFKGKVVDYHHTGNENYLMIGSILNDRFMDGETVVWGSGIQTAKEKLTRIPKKVCAVRGPVTHEYLTKNGVKCPKVYGDPAMLIPYCYYPVLPKKYEIGFIPHWSSLSSKETADFCKDKRVHLIKISDYLNWKTFINEILSCKYIVSESLHGLIMAEAYGIPNLWVDVTLKGVYDVKFQDFYLSIGKSNVTPLKVTAKTKIETIMEELENYKPGKMPDMKALVDACPVELDDEFVRRVKENVYPKVVTVPRKTEYESGISVCVTAYKSKNYLKDCLDSIEHQTWFKTHDNWEVIVGVDGCQETLDYLMSIAGRYRNLRVYMMDSNRGTYVTTNTIMSLAKYDGLLRFDSDDVMLPRMVEEIMLVRKKQDIVKFMMKNFGPRNDAYIACGQIYIRHTAFDEFGGYQPWVCGADSEFWKRVSKFCRVKFIDKVLFKRRVHEGSLTTSKSTGGNSKIRERYAAIIKRMNVRSRAEAVIRMETNTCKEMKVEGEPVSIAIQAPPERKVVKKAKPNVKEKPKVGTKYNKEKPATKGWSEFFGLA